MITINLLPEKVRTAEKLKKTVALGSIFYILVAAAVGWQYWRKDQEVKVVQAEIKKLQIELDSPKLTDVVKEVEKFSMDKDDLKTKKAILDSVRLQQAFWIRLLDVIPDLLPERVWVTKLDTIRERDRVKVVLEGNAESPEVFADFYSNLEAHDLISEPNVKDSLSSTTVFGKRVVKFKVEFFVEEFT
jgi:Tfp pilus assembly protein PilN